ncbi:MAG TPA: hypothetical protein VES39_04725 [Rhodospirillales bacterium]|nr:hypothetical protein [Rhodospirillales bacterium]
MTATCLPVLTSQAAIGRSCLALLTSTLGWYGSLLDPRPDLAVPARRVRLIYGWWW